MSLGLVLASINHFTIYLESLRRERKNIVWGLKRRHKITRIPMMKNYEKNLHNEKENIMG